VYARTRKVDVEHRKRETGCRARLSSDARRSRIDGEETGGRGGQALLNKSQFAEKVCRGESVRSMEGRQKQICGWPEEKRRVPV